VARLVIYSKRKEVKKNKRKKDSHGTREGMKKGMA